MATVHNTHTTTAPATAMTGAAATASSAYDTMHHDADNPVAKKILWSLVIIVALSVGGYVAYEISINNKSPEEIVTLLTDHGQAVIKLFWDTGGEVVVAPPAGGEEVVAPPSVSAPAPVPAPEVVVPAPPLTEPEELLADEPVITDLPSVDDVEQSSEPPQDLPRHLGDNPYLELPNRMPNNNLQFARAWSIQEEEVWRSGLTHQFVWQQHKTVQDVITLKLAGSDAILWEALNNPRLWTRMKALIGLAKFGMKVDGNTVLQALGEEHPSLVANYFKRFTVKNGAAERFVMRYALRTVGPRARRHIIKALVVGRDELSEIYLVAATLDKDRRVRRWAEAELRRQNLPLGKVEEYLQQITSSSF